MTMYDESWSGPLPPDGLPERGLHAVRLSIRHHVDGDREQALADALASVMGKATVMHYALIRRGLAWNKPRWKALASVGRRRIRLRATHLKASQIRTIVECLAELDGARDLRIRGRINGRK